jgi:hypothetical protein
MVLLVAASIYGLTGLALGLTHNRGAVLVNVFWAAYDIVMLWGVMTALLYKPADEEPDAEAASSTGVVAPLYPQLTGARGNR